MYYYTITETEIKEATLLTLKDNYEKALVGASFAVDCEGDLATTNTYYKQLYLMKVLAVDYLHLIELNDNEMITEEEYYELASSDIWGQLKELSKSDDKVSDVAIAIMNSYNIFKSMLDDEIQNEKERHNDILFRLEREMKLNATPEMLEQIEKQKNDVMDKLNELGKSAE